MTKKQKSPKGSFRQRPEMEITWYGTNSFVIRAAGERIAVDPFMELMGGENPNAKDDYADADTILITHGHFDHLAYVPELLEQGDYTVFCTATPAKTLGSFLEDTSQVVEIRPGMELKLGQVTIRVLRGQHIRFDRKLILRTALSPRMLRHARNLPFLLWALRSYPEGRETLVYELEAEGKRIQLLGSLGLCDEETYQLGADLLILPYQGNSRLEPIAEQVLDALRPKRVLLSHFDDAFPPISTHVATAGLKQLMQTTYPQIQVVKPVAGKPVHIA